MPRRNEWRTMAASVIYAAYPDHDLLPIDPPEADESIAAFKLRAEEAGDTLFLFLCREADDEIDAEEYLTRLDRAARDIDAVRDAFVDGPHPVASGSTPHPVVQQSTGSERREPKIRITLDADWIELSLTCSDARGLRSGTVSSSLHTTQAHAEEFNAAMAAVESMVLAHACAGVDVTDPRYVEGLRTCIEACGNNL